MAKEIIAVNKTVTIDFEINKQERVCEMASTQFPHPQDFCRLELGFSKCDYEIPEKKNQKNKFALDEEDLEQVEQELEQVQEQPLVTSIN